MPGKLALFLALLAAMLMAAPLRTAGQTGVEVRRKFLDLRDDKVPHNCERATEWLFPQRERLKDDLVDELYKTDWQGRDAICRILFKTSSFVPDDRFTREALLLLRSDQIMGNSDETVEWLFPRRAQLTAMFQDEFYKTDDQGREALSHLLYHTDSFTPDERLLEFMTTRFRDAAMNDEDWQFIHDRFEIFEPFLKAQIGRTNATPHSMFVLWATAWVMKKRGVLDRYSNLFTPAVLTVAAGHLRTDTNFSNAGLAVRLFLLLGDQSLPVLREAAHSSDPQARNLARATLDALGGKRRGFGYLQAKVELTRTPFGPEVPDPDWLAAVTQPYQGNDRPY
jgi:hypothetical protein